MTNTTNFVIIMQEARAAVRLHLRELAGEILTWHNTGILPDGRLRQIAAPLRVVASHDHLTIAEKMVVDAALEAASEKS